MQFVQTHTPSEQNSYNYNNTSEYRTHDNLIVGYKSINRLIMEYHFYVILGFYISKYVVSNLYKSYEFYM